MIWKKAVPRESSLAIPSETRIAWLNKSGRILFKLEFVASKRAFWVLNQQSACEVNLSWVIIVLILRWCSFTENLPVQRPSNTVAKTSQRYPQKGCLPRVAPGKAFDGSWRIEERIQRSWVTRWQDSQLTQKAGESGVSQRLCVYNNSGRRNKFNTVQYSSASPKLRLISKLEIVQSTFLSKTASSL